jgi:hypothetical protein
MFRLIAINFSQKSPHFSLLSPTSPCELSEREVTSPSNLKVVGALEYIEYWGKYNYKSYSIFVKQCAHFTQGSQNT